MFWVTLSVHNPRLCDLLQILALSPEDSFPLVFFLECSAVWAEVGGAVPVVSSPVSRV